ncbi:MAG: SGNH/GDSL hydrolase family protein [Firmicutes bacterium]|nr:SGNH/GDSL hydrolase family protein [Bacillota bacterium]
MKKSVMRCAFALAIGPVLLTTMPSTVAWASQTTTATHEQGQQTNSSRRGSSPYRVLVLGSSVADGWKDDQGGGYLRRAFGALAQSEHRKLVLLNHAVPGRGAWALSPYITSWIQSAHANAVVIAWGGLDDAYARTPIPLFSSFIRQEIQTALAAHDIVMVITPPVSRASYTQFRVAQPLYLNSEMQVARSFHSPHVFVFDVFDTMKTYLQMHHQSYVPYMADGWHPNVLGHRLAGQLLLSDLVRQFHTAASLAPPTSSVSIGFNRWAWSGHTPVDGQ